MTLGQKLKKNLLIKIEKLPEDKIQEVLDFVNFILFIEKRNNSNSQKREKVMMAEKNPLTEFIGGVSHGSLAKRIDEELYGS